MQIKSIAVFCGSSPGLLPEYRDCAVSFGALLAREGITVVYGGANVGLMNAVADGALKAGGKVVGVIPNVFSDRSLSHTGLTQLVRVDGMHQRKKTIAELSDAFVALPGGVGTIEEIFEAITWAHIGLHAKACAFLNVAGYYDHLFCFMRQMTEQRFLKQQHLDAIIVESNGPALLARIRAHKAIKLDKWMDKTEPNGVAPGSLPLS
jgi:hypothetical protein